MAQSMTRAHTTYVKDLQHLKEGHTRTALGKEFTSTETVPKRKGGRDAGLFEQPRRCPGQEATRPQRLRRNKNCSRRKARDEAAKRRYKVSFTVGGGFRSVPAVFSMLIHLPKTIIKRRYKI